jgi:glycosyltransferase involved in cell wall biosynthesis
MTELPEYDLLVAGSGPYREELKRVAHRHDVADSVEFLGYVDEGRLQSLYAGSEAYITMSTLEAYGRTVGEALAAGTECIVRNRGALRDWTKYARVTAVADPRKERIAAAVREREQSETSAALPTWESVTDDVAKIYTQLVPEG